MNHTLPRLKLLLDNVTLLSDASFRIGGGELFNSANLGAMPLGDDPACVLSTQQRALRGALATVFYMVAYARVYQGGPVTAAHFLAPSQPDAAFTATLASANAGAERWDAGWRIYKTEPTGAVHVQKGNTAILVQAGQYASGAIGSGAAPGGLRADPACARIAADATRLLLRARADGDERP